ncbi:sulfotransferase domain-containing protein [Candidatus Pelagibacter sp.]|uniref:sulfotransferase domain-containing protein n=1 Tax=Candidatus Pelagibacter sp. TaxID=2024849 RepID=UPI003F850B76
MIVWLASYPKSGNTLLRSLLSSYIFSRDGNFNFELLKNIKQFPAKSLFKQIGVDINNDEEMYKNYINSQKIFNKKDTIRFLKTHSCFMNTKTFQFTDRHNTLGVIYIVRDPRNIVSSYSHHFQKTPHESFECLLSHQVLPKDARHCTTYLGSWKFHYNSWKVFRRFNKYLLVRYEDLINDTEKTFLNILKFIAHLGRVKFTYDKEKFENSIKSTEFENLQTMEAKESFTEAKEDKKTGKKIRFFNMGIKNDWKKILDEKIKNKLEKELGDEMKELNYL